MRRLVAACCLRCKGGKVTVLSKTRLGRDMPVCEEHGPVWPDSRRPAWLGRVHWTLRRK